MTTLTSTTIPVLDDDLAAQGKMIGLIPAAGIGSRMQTALPKQFLTIGNQTLLALSVGALLRHPMITQVVVVVSKDDTVSVPLLTHAFEQQIGRQLFVAACGGATRAESVAHGLHYIRDALHHRSVHDWVLVHDAARPGLTQAALTRLITQVLACGQGGLLALPISDTVKSKQGAAAMTTVPRDGLWTAQTPQMFRVTQLSQALDAGIRSNAVMTDEAQAIEAAGLPVQLIMGERINTKVTVPDDLNFVAALMHATAAPNTGTQHRHPTPAPNTGTQHRN